MKEKSEKNNTSESSKNPLKELLISWSKRDLAIFEVYMEEMPEEFRKKIEFKDFYNFYIRELGEFLESIEEEEYEDSNEDENEPIPEGRLCKGCKKNPKMFGDVDYCDECVSIYKDKAEIRMEELVKELMNDEAFKNLTSLNARKAYVKNKYKDENKQNKFIYLTKLAEQAHYNLKLSPI